MLTGKKILLIEDDPKLCYALHAVLEARGYRVTAYSSAEAAAKLDGQKIDAAIIDVRLPEQPGTEFAEALQKKFGHIRIILITAFDDLEKYRSEFKTIPILAKPFTMPQLTALLEAT